MLRGADGEVAKDVQRRAYAVQKRMKRLAPKRSGALRRGIHVKSNPGSDTEAPSAAIISMAQHTMAVEYGRKGLKPVIPIQGEYALKFQPKRGAKSIFRFEVGPTTATHFMERSVDAALD